MSRRRYNDFLHGNSSGSTTTCKRLALRRRLLRLEPLEPRRLLATVNWDGNTDGDGDGVTWTDRFNWTSDALPGAADDAVIGATFAADTITHASGTTTIRSLTSEATVAVTGGTFTITDNSTINNALDVSGTASLTLSSLTLGGTGTVTNDATVNLAVSTVNTALNNQGTLLVLPGVAGSTINGALSTEDMSTVRVEGNASVGPATLTVANGFTNNGTIELTSINGALHGATLNVSSGTLINVGEIESAPGTGGARRLNAQLDNRGTLAVLQSLDMNNNTGRTFTSTDGAIEVDTGKTLTIINGTTVLGSNSVLTGSGGINLDGTHTLELTTDLTLTTTKPTLAFPGAVTVNGPGDLINQASLTIHNDTINADLNNQGTLLVLPRGDSRISGLLTTGDMSTIRLEGNHDDARASLTVDNGFTNNGLIELTSINGDRHGATLNVTNGTLINAAGGEIRSSLGTGGARTLNAQLENQGTLTVSQSLGITNTSRTLTSTDGTIQVDTGKTLTITNGTTVLGSSTLLSGDGQISLAGTQTLELASDLTLTSTTFVFPGAVTVNGPGDLINQASLSLSGDTINADLNNQGTLLVETRGDSTINGALTTNGTSIIRVVGNASEGSVNFTVEDGFINNGLIELTSINGALHGATLNVTNGTLINAADGEIRSSVGTGGTRTLNAQLDNRGSLVVAQSLTLSEGSSAHTNSGAVDVQAGTLAFVSSSTYTQTAGTTAVADGATLSSTLPIQLQGGVLEGGGTVDSNVSNVGGTVSPGVSPGRLTIDGDYTQESGGTLLIEVGGRTPATGFDQLVVSGAATLAGRLQVDLINGFTPEIDDSFLVLDGETTGTFSTLDLDRLPPGRKWEVAINSVTLNVVEDPTDLVLTKTDSVESVNAGQDLTYTITVTNAGMVEGVNALLSDVLPSGTTFQSFTVPAGWTPSTPAVGSGGTVTATTPSLAGGDTATFTLVVKVDRGLADGTTLSNTATVTSQTPEFNDDNNSATVETFVTVPPNEPPVLDPIGNRSGSEGTAITFTATASDPNQDDELTFSLDAGVPAGATINSATGAFSWTPSEAQGPGTFSITVRVTDDGDPALSDSETITITVSEVNQPPVLNPIGNRSGDEGTAITFTATASDPDSPANALVFSLDTGAPTGATIDAATGAFSWTPSEAQGPGTFSITVRVTDDGDPALSDSETIAIAVSEVNQPPVLNPIGNRSGDEGTAITFTATASDLDSPANAIAFSLDTGAPTGATIDAATGAFSWTPSEAQGPGTFSITVRVTDDGDPAL
ncbi:MAG: putative Ig domain-containing protein, partial [Pirellulales bacterium]